jgi:acyl carrier protein
VVTNKLSIEALESILIEMFELTLETHGVTRESNFYASGGDSLSALELMHGLTTRLNIDIDMSELPLWSSVSEIAEFLREAILISRSKG